MQRELALGIGVLALLTIPAAAHAQDERRTGLVIATSGVGVEWRLSDKTAIRTDVGFAISTSEVEDITSDSESSAFSVGVAGLFTMKEWSDLRAYVTPRFAVSWSSSESGSQSIVVESTTTTYSFGGAFGLQYGLGERFAVFGETGLVYSHASGETETSSTINAVLDRSTTGFGTRSTVGVVFYF